MDKLIAWLTVPPTVDRGSWQAGLRERLVPALLDAGAQRVRINLPDAAVAAGAGLRQSPDGRYPDALVQIWSGDEALLVGSGLHGLIDAVAEEWHGWLVEERVPLPNTQHPPARGERTKGWAQIALLVRPEGQAESEWLYAWQGRHTVVAIETQSTFEYVQNRVLAPLRGDAPECVAIVEECFPEAALTDPLTFFDAAGDVARFKANLARMMASCDRFITPGSIRVLPTSQYEFGATNDSAK